MINFHIYAYDDAPMLRECVDSLPDGVPIHVFDGRHADFPGERDLTLAIERFCTRHPDCRYHAPPDGLLPFGHDHDLARRGAGYAKSRFVFDRLPPDEWTCKLDTDERLTRFDPEPALGDLAPDHKYCPLVAGEGEQYHVARLFKPDEWTPWVGDCLLPRALFPLDTSLERLHTIWTTTEFRAIRFLRRLQIGGIEIENVGDERPDDYQRRRIEQLETRGRPDRAVEVRESL